MRYDRALLGETLDVLSLFFQKALGDEQGEVGVAVPGVPLSRNRSIVLGSPIDTTDNFATATNIADNLGVTRGSVNRWLQWFDACGLDGLRTGDRPGRPPRLTTDQRSELVALIEAGPSACGFDTGIWTGPMIRELIRRQYSVTYHAHHIPRMLHALGFSVQRPRKRLARADAEKQEIWLTKSVEAMLSVDAPMCVPISNTEDGFQ